MYVKRTLGSLFIALLFITGTGYAQGTLIKSFQVKKGDNLVVKVLGDIEITSWDKDEVVVEVNGIDEEDDKKGLSLTQSGNAVLVNYDQSKGTSSDLSFIIRAPETFNFSLKTSGGSVISRGNINGSFTAKTAGGNIEIGPVTNQVDLKTAGGDIIIGNADGDVTLTTSGGDITTGNIKGAAKISTSGGDIKIGNVGGDVRAATSGGDIRIGRASGYTKLASSGGDIHVDKASGGLSVSTSGGSITALDNQGTINAVTSGGDIVAEVTSAGKDDSKLITSGGKITLMVAENLHISIQATISLSGEDDVYKVYSDFKVSRQHVTDSEAQYEYELNGGGSVIRLRTNGNDIIIKKLLK